MSLTKRSVAEFIGTFWLLGVAVVQSWLLPFQISDWTLGVAFAFGLTVLTMAYAIGHISGCHLNPAVSVAGRWRTIQSLELPAYIISQVLGAILLQVLYFIATEKLIDLRRTGVQWIWRAFPGGYSFSAGLVTEIVMTECFSSSFSCHG